MVDDCLVFFVCYREGQGGMISSSSESNREPLVHLSSDLAIFSCTLPSRLLEEFYSKQTVKGVP